MAYPTIQNPETLDNKDRVIMGAKAVGIVLISFIAIMSNVAVWNAAGIVDLGTTVILASIVNFLLEATGIVLLAKKWFPKLKNGKPAKE